MSFTYDLRRIYNESPWLFWVLAIACILLLAGHLELILFS